MKKYLNIAGGLLLGWAVAASWALAKDKNNPLLDVDSKAEVWAAQLVNTQDDICNQVDFICEEYVTEDGKSGFTASLTPEAMAQLDRQRLLWDAILLADSKSSVRTYEEQQLDKVDLALVEGWFPSPNGKSIEDIEKEKNSFTFSAYLVSEQDPDGSSNWAWVEFDAEVVKLRIESSPQKFFKANAIWTLEPINDMLYLKIGWNMIREDIDTPDGDSEAFNQFSIATEAWVKINKDMYVATWISVSQFKWGEVGTFKSKYFDVTSSSYVLEDEVRIDSYMELVYRVMNNDKWVVDVSANIWNKHIEDDWNQVTWGATVDYYLPNGHTKLSATYRYDGESNVDVSAQYKYLYASIMKINDIENAVYHAGLKFEWDFDDLSSWTYEWADKPLAEKNSISWKHRFEQQIQSTNNQLITDWVFKKSKGRLEIEKMDREEEARRAAAAAAARARAKAEKEEEVENENEGGWNGNGNETPGTIYASSAWWDWNAPTEDGKEYSNLVAKANGWNFEPGTTFTTQGCSITTSSFNNQNHNIDKITTDKGSTTCVIEYDQPTGPDFDLRQVLSSSTPSNSVPEWQNTSKDAGRLATCSIDLNPLLSDADAWDTLTAQFYWSWNIWGSDLEFVTTNIVWNIANIIVNWWSGDWYIDYTVTDGKATSSSYRATCTNMDWN